MATTNNAIYYDWQKTMSRDAKFNMVVTARGRGKTYGIRKSAIQDFINDGFRFVEVVRHKTQLKGEEAVQNGYFDKLVLKNEFPGYVFTTKGTSAYIAKAPAKEGGKVKWQKIGYFVALSQMQNAKQRTFANVKKVIFDEFIIDKRTQARYLRGEFELFVNIIDSCAREEVDENGEALGTPVHAYLLGNACDLINPYFQHYKISKRPRQGYTWLVKGDVLLHFDSNEMYSKGKAGTLVGRLLEGTREAGVIIGNEFDNGDEYNIGKKSPGASFRLGLKWQGTMYGIWEDFARGLVFVTGSAPEGSGAKVLALSRDDNCANVIQVRRNDKLLRTIFEFYYADLMKFENVGVRENFLTLMENLGIK